MSPQLHPCWPQLLHRLTEIGVIHGLLGSQPLLMVISQQLVQEVKDFRTDQMPVLTVDEVLPALPGMPAKGQRDQLSLHSTTPMSQGHHLPPATSDYRWL